MCAQYISRYVLCALTPIGFFMARRRSRNIKTGGLPVSLVDEMRGLVQATRPVKGLRSLSPAKARSFLQDLFKEVTNEYKVSQRQVSKSGVSRTSVSGRRPPAEHQVLRERVPTSVRDLFQGAQRALVCSSRKSRREIVFAMRRAGKAGARRNRKARWTTDSRITCRR